MWLVLVVADAAAMLCNPGLRGAEGGVALAMGVVVVVAVAVAVLMLTA